MTPVSPWHPTIQVRVSIVRTGLFGRKSDWRDSNVVTSSYIHIQMTHTYLVIKTFATLRRYAPLPAVCNGSSRSRRRAWSTKHVCTTYVGTSSINPRPFHYSRTSLFLASYSWLIIYKSTSQSCFIGIYFYPRCGWCCDHVSGSVNPVSFISSTKTEASTNNRKKCYNLPWAAESTSIFQHPQLHSFQCCASVNLGLCTHPWLWAGLRPHNGVWKHSCYSHSGCSWLYVLLPGLRSGRKLEKSWIAFRTCHCSHEEVKATDEACYCSATPVM